MLAVLCCVCGYGIVCLSFSLWGLSLFIIGGLTCLWLYAYFTRITLQKVTPSEADPPHLEADPPQADPSPQRNMAPGSQTGSDIIPLEGTWDQAARQNVTSYTHPPVNRITHRCKNITFPQLRWRKVTRCFFIFWRRSKSQMNPPVWLHCTCFWGGLRLV